MLTKGAIEFLKQLDPDLEVVITPGYPQLLTVSFTPHFLEKLMSTNERYTHFQGFAKLQIDDLSSLFANLSDAEEHHYDPRLIALCRESIIRYLSRCAYDLVEHTLLSLDIDTTRALISDVPDLTEWPPTE